MDKISKEEAAKKQEEINKLEPERISKQIENYSKVLQKKNEISNDIISTELSIEKMNVQITTIERDIEKSEKQIDEYNKNKESLDNLNLLYDKKKEITIQIGEKERKAERERDRNRKVRDRNRKLKDRNRKLKDINREVKDRKIRKQKGKRHKETETER